MRRSLVSLPGGSARWINAALIAATAAAMLLVILLVIGTVEAERGQRRQAQQTSAILDELRDIGRAALNAETGQRGYLLSLDRRYLGPFYNGRDRMEPSLRRLRALLEPRADARQLALLDEVEALSRAKFRELGRSIALVENGDLIEARRLVLTDEGQETMERLRRAIGELERIELAELAEAVTKTERAERRVMPLLGGLLALLAISLVAAGRLIARSARAEAVAAQAEALAAARDRADLLARELNHRVKNLFAVVLAIVRLSARDAPEARAVTDSIAQRVQALLKAHDVSQGELDRPEVSLVALVETTLAPYRSPTLTASISGPPITLHARSITPVGLVLHELTTNAVKYGGWSRPGGSIAIDWKREGGELVLNWRESGVPIAEQPAREGFGSMLMTSAARQLGGGVERHFPPEGAVITIRFPADG
ncbi:MAG: CHASE3 domain-containing protein [Qipengyuania sp.]|nr:CHASE3 domain-containing protein [Qipengyuania sp.]